MKRSTKKFNFAKKQTIKNAFTLAEVLSVVVILGVIAAITISTTVKNTRERAYIAKAKKTYATLEQATEIYMIEHGCVGDISVCFSALRQKRTPPYEAFSDIAKNLNIVDSTSFYRKSNGMKEEDLNVQVSNLNSKDWLPDIAYQYNGKKQAYPWQGISKNSGITDHQITYYLLKDGTTMLVQFPDDLYKSGWGLFDVNGKKLPNKVGVDVYPFGWSITYKTEAQRLQNEANYGSYAKGLNPYCTEDDADNGGLCVLRNGEKKCNPDDPTSPLAFLLKHNKIPNK